MGWFDLFKKRPPPRPVLRPPPPASGAAIPAKPEVEAPAELAGPASEPVRPEQVRRLLFDAVASMDEGRLEALCREHKDLILLHGLDWTDVPTDLRSNAQLHEWYATGLRAISRFCAEKLGHTEMLDRLARAEAELASARESAAR